MMAFNVSGLDELMQGLEELGEVEEVAKEMIDAATPTLEEALKACIRDSADKGYATGALEKSIKSTKAKQNAYGYMAAVRPTGVDEKGVRNGEKLAYLEYGTHKQAARPVLGRAINRAEKGCLKEMQEVFNKRKGAL